MERANFDSAVQRIEQRYRGRTRELASATRRWLLMGYGVITGTALVIGAIGVTLIWFGASLGTTGILMIVAGSLAVAWGIGQVAQLILVHNALPTELPLDLDRAQPLFQMLQQLRKKLEAEPLARVCIDHQFNASVVQSRPLGILNGLATPGSFLAKWFPPVNVLVIGLPLIMTLTECEFRALLAHELGHISGRHGRKRGHIFHLRQQWHQFFESLHHSSSATLRTLLFWLHGMLVKWYWPRLNSYMFVLSRHQEYEADQCSVMLTDTSTTTKLLWKVHVLGRYQEGIGNEKLWESLDISPLPPRDYCQQIANSIATPDQDGAEHAMRTSLCRLTDNSDTHPSLSDRVRAISAQAGTDLTRFQFPVMPEASAAECLLGAQLERLTQQVNDLWYRKTVTTWKESHRRLKAVATVANRQQSDTEIIEISAADVPTTWERALEILEVQGYKAAEPLVKSVLCAAPDHTGALCAMGGSAIAGGDDRAEDLLTFVIEKNDRMWTPRAAELLIAHYADVGEKEKLATLRRRMDQYDKLRQQADAERCTVSARDTLDSHGLGNQQLAAVVETLRRNKFCHAGYLVRKLVKHLPEEPMFVLSVSSAPEITQQEQSIQSQRMVTSLMLRLPLPGRTLVVTSTGHHAAVAKRVAQMPDAKVFSRTSA